MSKVQTRLLGLNLYQRIYNSGHELDAQLQTHIVTVYQTFISFAIAATKYYGKVGLGKFTRSHQSLLAEQKKGPNTFAPRKVAKGDGAAISSSQSDQGCGGIPR